MNKKVCEKFENVWEDFPNTLTDDGKYQFKDNTFLNSYCGSYSCDTDLKKVDAGFFYLVNELFGPSGVFKNNEKSNINAVEYIIIWLSYMLNLKDSTGNILTNFYKIYIKNQEKYKNTINGVEGCSNYDDLIYKKNELMNITNEKLSKFYAPFKLLCEMYSAFDENKKNCTNCSGKAQEFVDKYKNLKEDSSITNDSSCNKILSTLSNDYNNLKNKCSNISSLPDIKTAQNNVQTSKQSSKQSPEHTSATNSVQISEQISGKFSEDPSSSSIGNKLFTVLSIFGAIAFFLGISYKYSLFGFRKRAQKQYLREKIKNIKKRMNH
ncbi:BIR protein [Plasmodium berghei]|uniref:BIR protein n=2 Tax=Plasmodium berghei TaxID=5821 RepID=A0A509ATU7_PLABA|nr:BIR protein [Plasmodium berghei ANKA]CXJ06213.1 BIR protein [Plasmodium berghei]SBW38348.1 BIR protein [Plasmodium berghei]SCL83359.1 BIR protein [Plasmodium berghei]SCL83582.1 BIR protein [Plasmodium berghei]SCL87683.1 BIR protein [Plasmodium berghei]|eukprot:XP_034423814.1 BIR protein [Plasmodium berghei ANKA]